MSYIRIMEKNMETIDSPQKASGPAQAQRAAPAADTPSLAKCTEEVGGAITDKWKLIAMYCLGFRV